MIPYATTKVNSYAKKLHPTCGAPLGVANMRVCFMNRSMIEHNGLGITCFSVDVLKDMVAC